MDLERMIRMLGIGTRINTSPMERLNGTLRTQQRRMVDVAAMSLVCKKLLEYALWLWRDLYNWHRVHGSLQAREPAMALVLGQGALAGPSLRLSPGPCQRDTAQDLSESAVEA